MSFENIRRRDAFIEDCHQKAWGAQCHADWIATKLDKHWELHQNLKEEHTQIADNLKSMESEPDFHSKDNREKARKIRAHMADLTDKMRRIEENAQRGQQAMHELQDTAETSLQLAKHAETWPTDEPEAKKEHTKADMSK